MSKDKYIAVDELKNILSMVNESLRFAESKNGALLTLCLGLLFVGHDTGTDIQCYIVFLFRLFFVGSMMASAGLCLLSFFPRLSESSLLQTVSNKTSSANLLYFGHIASLSIDEYSRHIKDIINNDEGLSVLETAYVKQIKANSVIASQKYRFFALAMKVTSLGLLVLAILLFITM